MPSTAALKKLYSGDYEFRVDSTSLIRFKVVAQNVIDRLRHLNPSGRSLLDVGTGYGTFVEVATSNGMDAIGIEPAKNLYMLANSKIGKRILHTDLNTFIKFNTMKFDFVSAIHVIEHLKEPRKFLTSVLSLLKPRGVLYIETPNSDSHLVRFEKENYTFLTPPDHTNLFSNESLNILINGLGPNTTFNFYTYSYPEHLVGIIRIIKQSLTHYHVSKDGSVNKSGVGTEKYSSEVVLPFFDRVVAPILTPLLNIGNKGSFLQVFIQKKN